MIKQLLVLFSLMLVTALAFAPHQQHQSRSNTALSLAVMPPMPPSVVHVSQQQPLIVVPSSSQPLQQGIQSYLQVREELPSMSSASLTLSLQDRKIPTAEEIAAKKRNFNFWFWGGGFVAPFLATFYYFGFKFWEK